jgi:hypothetical protein
MSSALMRHGWEIVFQPQLFARQYEQLKAEVKRLKQELDQQSFLQHPQVKLLALPPRVRCSANDGSRGWVCPIATAFSFGSSRPMAARCC